MPGSEEFSGPPIKSPSHPLPGEERSGPAIKPPIPLTALDMSWGVLDLQTSETTTFDATGGHFPSVQGHRYLVAVRVSDAVGIQKITLDGSGRFRAATKPDNHGVDFEAATTIPASIPHQEFVNSDTAPTLQDLIALMKPDIGAFDYYELSCGFHHFEQTSANLEYFAIGGVMTFSATAVNSRGDVATASLTTSP